MSRPTAQRYLTELHRKGLIELELSYGATGRPVHRYRSPHR
jgi:response regulator of citrate/malate metabolism